MNSKPLRKYKFYIYKKFFAKSIDISKFVVYNISYKVCVLPKLSLFGEKMLQKKAFLVYLHFMLTVDTVEKCTI